MARLGLILEAEAGFLEGLVGVGEQARRLVQALEAPQQFQSGISFSWMSSFSHTTPTEVGKFDAEAPFWEEQPG